MPDCTFAWVLPLGCSILRHYKSRMVDFALNFLQSGAEHLKKCSYRVGITRRSIKKPSAGSNSVITLWLFFLETGITIPYEAMSATCTMQRDFLIFAAFKVGLLG